MKARRLFLKAFFLVVAVILLATTAYARPRTTVKNVTIREENPKGSKSALVLPYAFSSDSMGFTVGVGAALKGYGQEQLLLGATAFGSFDRAVGLFLGMWDYRPSWARRFFSVPKEWSAIIRTNGPMPHPFMNPVPTGPAATTRIKTIMPKKAVMTTGPILSWSTCCRLAPRAMTHWPITV